MPLYELVLCYPEREEVRLGERPLSVGQTFGINYDEWEVIWEREPADQRATACYLCVLTGEQRARAEKMREDDAAQRERIRLLEARRESLGHRLQDPAR